MVCTKCLQRGHNIQTCGKLKRLPFSKGGHKRACTICWKPGHTRGTCGKPKPPPKPKHKRPPADRDSSFENGGINIFVLCIDKGYTEEVITEEIITGEICIDRDYPMETFPTLEKSLEYNVTNIQKSILGIPTTHIDAYKLNKLKKYDVTFNEVKSIDISYDELCELLKKMKRTDTVRVCIA